MTRRPRLTNLATPAGPGHRLGRREFLALAAAGPVAFLAACDSGAGPAAGASRGRLSTRPSAPTGQISPGFTRLGLSSGRDGFLWVPSTYDPEFPSPLMVLLHGAGRSSADWSGAPLEELLGPSRVVVLAPDSRRFTWDRTLGGFGDDVRFIDAALALAFGRCSVDPARIALAGFSDGGSYALSLGATNGDLFPALIAFSPGAYEPGERVGRPRIFQSHGTGDRVLEIDRTSRVIVPRLRAQGYDVTYVEFDGGHVLPLEIAGQAVNWWLPSR